ncbi:vancomycin high temperature exclusion protein [Paenibacillus konkukensis]|uniref:Vancomycin high temperature exclusion protein n=1 Tax=Paenibacillus konkukensis TaxID=2020716 RepID=A0ABY4RQS3_9BACL|nr:ElyC/SanA/YdcF family protein [Paenibacillus konkukensis]UQZ84849.1 vancomycin high temperature exclusion protein [Paenibacillus konkukensis]
MLKLRLRSIIANWAARFRRSRKRSAGRPELRPLIPRRYSGMRSGRKTADLLRSANPLLWNKKVLLLLILLLAAPVACALGINAYVQSAAAPYIVGVQDAPEADAILVLGARVYPDGSVSSMLNDRLEVGLELHKAGKASKFIVSGDHGQITYDEVNTMRRFLEQRNIPAQHIFMDHAGFSTYESMYRARDIFQTKKLLIVTQQYHLMRAVYEARQMGLDAYGVASDKQRYAGMPRYEAREVLARNKDFLYVHLLKPKPTYLGDPIPVSSADGRETLDGKRP